MKIELNKRETVKVERAKFKKIVLTSEEEVSQLDDHAFSNLDSQL